MASLNVASKQMLEEFIRTGCVDFQHNFIHLIEHLGFIFELWKNLLDFRKF